MKRQNRKKKSKVQSGENNALDNINKIRQLEKEIEVRSLQTNRLEAELKNATKGATVPRRGGPGPCLSRTRSVERNVEDQLLKDLQNSIERENDLKEQTEVASVAIKKKSESPCEVKIIKRWKTQRNQPK